MSGSSLSFFTSVWFCGCILLWLRVHWDFPIVLCMAFFSDETVFRNLFVGIKNIFEVKIINWSSVSKFKKCSNVANYGLPCAWVMFTFIWKKLVQVERELPHWLLTLLRDSGISFHCVLLSLLCAPARLFFHRKSAYSHTIRISSRSNINKSIIFWLISQF